MKEYEVIEAMHQAGVIAIVRGTTLNEAMQCVQALFDGGIRLVEVTFNTDGVESIMKALCHHFKDQMIIGAGTVLDAESARMAILSGAQFILSPSLHPEVLQMAHKYSVLAVPGVLTPTEAMQAWELGAQMIKLFPAGCLPPSYIHQLLGPLNQLSIMVVGGIGPANIGSYISAGASCVGIGSDLVNLDMIHSGDFQEIQSRAEQVCALVKKAKKGL